MNTKQVQHTPGPWRIGDAGHTVFGPPNGQPSPKTIARDLSRADARLIAAAPDLLEGARRSLAFVRSMPDADNVGLADFLSALTAKVEAR